ncbi:hypothetical protein CAPTEDRAFT_223782 [Capitella teleta]|uniref:WW domain-containing protein n=1 Tax=Capitella teleta TaxID=283909 RepID=R7TC97_CAPTE|nr:hypothetical protein CAPTEDRAFT_223782 [Capitella teleta]|eukprot:ELT91309.1 hypothetical protein CAPTEDRAFT_223782 [Capitella teleta]
MILPLSSELQQRIRSGVAITSFTQCVEELVLNSLDASCSCVAVRVDVPLGKIQVVDNGKGISHQDLQTVATRYCTSKCHVAEDLNNLVHYGYRGEALASVRDICFLLEVESRYRGNTDTYLKIFRQGSPLPTTESLKHRPSQGTTVTVHDLFHKMAVRKKALNSVLEFERLRHRMEAIALIHPGVSFTLRNDATSSKVLQTHKSSSVLKAFGDLFGSSKERYMKSISCSEDDFKVNGYLSTEGHSNKNLQFVFINDRLVLKTKIHKLISHLVAKSGFLKQKSNDLPKREAGHLTDSPSRNVDRHAIYIINVSCTLTEYDITFDPAKTLVEFKNWPGVLKCIENAVRKLFRAENLANVDEFSPEVRELFQREENSVLAESDEKGYGDGINTCEFGNNLQSLTALRRIVNDACNEVQRSVEKSKEHETLTEVRSQPSPELKTTQNEGSKVNQLPTCHMEGLRRIREKFQKKKNVQIMKKFTPKKSSNIDLLKGLSRIRARMNILKEEDNVSNPLKLNHNEIDDTSCASESNKRSGSPSHHSTSSKVIKITEVVSPLTSRENMDISAQTIKPSLNQNSTLTSSCERESTPQCGDAYDTTPAHEPSPTPIVLPSQRQFMTSEDLVQTIHDVDFNCLYRGEKKSNENPEPNTDSAQESSLLEHLRSKLQPLPCTESEDTTSTSTSPEPKKVRFKIGESTESESDVSLPGHTESITAQRVCGDYIMDLIPLDVQSDQPSIPRMESQGFDVKNLLRTAERSEESGQTDGINLSRLAATPEETELNNEWLTSLDPKSGKQIYIHRASGNSSYTEPSTDVSNAIVTHSHTQNIPENAVRMPPRDMRFDSSNSSVSLSPDSKAALEDMMIERDEHEEELCRVKWKNQDLSGLKCLLRDWVNPVFDNSGKAVMTAELKYSLQSQVKANRLLHNHSFTKDMLKSIEVINQVDGKFILCLMDTENQQGKCIVIIDQHAAHERVRLEQLIEDAHENNSDGTKCLKCMAVSPALVVPLTQHAIRVLSAYPKQLKRIGVECTFDPSDLVVVTGIPACVQSRDENEKRRGRSDFLLKFTRELLMEQVDILTATVGANSALPKAILQVLAAKACGGAIKFGDSISVNECERLVRGLQTCDLPFQCAHGRPSLIPLVDLKTIAQPKTNSCHPNLWKLREAMETT